MVVGAGKRLLTQSGFMVALGRARQAKGRQYHDGDVNMPAFLTAKNLKSFIPNDLAVTSSQIEFRTISGSRAFGYSADLLPLVCGVFLSAHAVFMIHPTTLGPYQEALTWERLDSAGKAALAEEARTENILRERTAIPDDSLNTRRFREVYITPNEALQWGLVQGVAEFALPKGNEIIQI